MSLVCLWLVISVLTYHVCDVSAKAYKATLEIKDEKHLERSGRSAAMIDPSSYRLDVEAMVDFLKRNKDVHLGTIDEDDDNGGQGKGQSDGNRAEDDSAQARIDREAAEMLASMVNDINARLFTLAENIKELMRSQFLLNSRLAAVETAIGVGNVFGSLFPVRPEPTAEVPSTASLPPTQQPTQTTESGSQVDMAKLLLDNAADDIDEAIDLLQSEEGGQNSQTAMPEHSDTTPVTAMLPDTTPKQQTAMPPHTTRMQQTAMPPHSTLKQQTAMPPHATPKQQTAMPPHATPKQQTAMPPHITPKQQTTMLPHGDMQQQSTMLPHGNTEQQMEMSTHVNTPQTARVSQENMKPQTTMPPRGSISSSQQGGSGTVSSGTDRNHNHQSNGGNHGNHEDKIVNNHGNQGNPDTTQQNGNQEPTVTYTTKNNDDDGGTVIEEKELPHGFRRYSFRRYNPFTDARRGDLLDRIRVSLAHRVVPVGPQPRLPRPRTPLAEDSYRRKNTP